MRKKRKPIIELKVNGWSRLSDQERGEAALWLKELANNLYRTGEYVDDAFTGEYP